MSSYQLCRTKRAVHPYYIESIGINVYTMEELCYYFCQNIYLLDASIINEKTALWIRKELGLESLYRRLHDQLEKEMGLGGFVVPILQEIGYLSLPELAKIKEQISRLEIQPQDIRKKMKADYLVEYGRYQAAVSMYYQILQERGTGKMGTQFYAALWNNMGSAYARMFQYEEAVDCYWHSYEMVRSNTVYHSYLAMLPYALSRTDYEKRIKELLVPQELLKKLETEKQDAAGKAQAEKKLQDMDHEALKIFLEQAKKDYHKCAAK